MKNNAYELMKEMWSIDEEIQKLTSELEKIAQISEREVLERRIDNLYADFLKYKHLLEDVKLQDYKLLHNKNSNLKSRLLFLFLGNSIY